MHWPLPGMILFTGVIGIIIFYGLQFFQKQQKTLLGYSKLALLISFLIYYLLQVLHLPYSYFFRILTQIALLAVVLVFIRDVLFMKPSNSKESANELQKSSLQKRLSYVLYEIAAVGIIVGAQFKILHWEFGFITGQILLIIGFVAATAAVLLGLRDTNP